MDAELVIRFIILAFLLLFSAFFSGSEVAFFSLDPVSKTKISASDQKNDKILFWLLRHPRQLIITLLVGNELVNITTSTVSATIINDIFYDASDFKRTIISIVFTLPFILIIGEITPKTIAIIISETWSRKVAPIVYGFSWIISPIRWIFRKVVDIIIFLTGKQSRPVQSVISEDDFLLLVEKGSKQGSILEQEKSLITKVFKFGDKVVKDVMTPLNKVYTIDVDTPIADIPEKLKKGTFSRVPVIREKTKEIVGVLHLKDILNLSDSSNTSVTNYLKPPFYVSQNSKCLRLLNEFQKRRTHMAIVIDQNGVFMGVVTLEDLLEELVGEIYDEKETFVGKNKK